MEQSRVRRDDRRAQSAFGLTDEPGLGDEVAVERDVAKARLPAAREIESADGVAIERRTEESELTDRIGACLSFQPLVGEKDVDVDVAIVQ